MCRVEELAAEVELVSALWVSAKNGGSLPQCVGVLSITDCEQGEMASCQCLLALPLVSTLQQESSEGRATYIMIDGLGIDLENKQTNKCRVVQELARADT